jgi:hypothetical protein
MSADDTDIAVGRSRGNLPQRVIAGLMVALIVGALIFSHRPRMMTNRPWVEPVADIPARANFNQLRAYIASNPYVIPKARYSPPLGLTVEPSPSEPDAPPRLGYSIREVSLLGMPLLAYREAGFVLYVDDGNQFAMVPLDDDGIKLLESQAGAPLSRNFTFPYWRYGWGLSLFVLIALWGVLQLNARRRYRRESGMI